MARVTTHVMPALTPVLMDTSLCPKKNSTYVLLNGGDLGDYFLLFIVMTFLVRECYGSPKISIKFVKIRQNSLKFTPKKCYDNVLNEEFFKKLFCKMKNVITRLLFPLYV
jgi:hypothetical protein